MKYVYCTIAIGEKYLKSAIKFAEKLNEKSITHKVLIITDGNHKEVKNTSFVKFNNNEVKFIKNYFNYNLKYIPIMESLKLDFDFVLFFDADWDLFNGYNESKLLSFLESFKNSNLDFIYERPHSIGDTKRDPHKCFWRHKVEPYGLLNTTRYDKAQVVNEQFLVFKNSPKLKTFVNKWKERNEFGVKNDIWAFAEGVEIGMSAVDANMNMDWKKMYELKDFFSFVANTGVTHIRF
jgi:hypothetical protein